MDKNLVILAPHVDDEFIGCYKKLSEVKKVIYFFELTLIRKEEAKKVCSYYDIECIFMNDPHNIFELQDYLEYNDVLLAPNIHDNHIDHKQINIMSKQLDNKKLYYSIDMNVDFKKNTPLDAKDKKKLFEMFYPSQSSLLSNDAYFLFESLQETDEEIFITIKTQFEALHNYPNAPEEVNFLRDLHRHIFKINVSIQVFSDDRELEFFMFKKEIDDMLKETVFKDFSINNMSCEMIARVIIQYIYKFYPSRSCNITVSEDGENEVTLKFNGNFNESESLLRLNI